MKRRAFRRNCEKYMYKTLKIVLKMNKGPVKLLPIAH